MIKLKRLRIWGSKNGKRVYIDQQGPSLTAEPEIPAIYACEDVLEAASSILDEVIDVWVGRWDTDKRMQEWADAWNEHETSPKEVYDIAAMREVEYQEFLRNGFPPSDWESIEEFLPKQGRLLRKNGPPPETNRKCRDCLKICEWIWYECFPGPTCGSAGWVAICKECKSWHKEVSVVIS